jgi:hypothetical protein
VIARLRIAPAPARVAVGELDRHLARCRRREEPAEVLVATIRGAGERTRIRVLTCFRLTDSVEARRTRSGVEVVAVFDGGDLDRDALERRLLAAAGGCESRLGWARFPDDGPTLDALLEAAR